MEQSRLDQIKEEEFGCRDCRWYEVCDGNFILYEPDENGYGCRKHTPCE